MDYLNIILYILRTNRGMVMDLWFYRSIGDIHNNNFPSKSMPFLIHINAINLVKAKWLYDMKKCV